jgi:hypothetical protein
MTQGPETAPGPVAEPSGGAAPDRFYDAETGGPLQLQLEQDGDSFRVLRRFGYRDPAHREPFVVPADPGRFRTDLASIPWMFAWLVPGLGSHLAAVILHDALVRSGGPPDHEGPDVDREEADRILRDAMASLGMPRLRRWLMWAGVMLATCWSALAPRWWWRTLVAGTLGVVGALGVLATLDVLDVVDVLPWMGDRPWWVEVLGGAAGAVAIPAALAVLWGRRWRVALIAGVALAFLLHVTAAVLAVYGVYRVAETVVSRPEGMGPDVAENLERAGEAVDGAAAAPDAGPVAAGRIARVGGSPPGRDRP